MNRAHTGHPDRSWLDDLLARGPFADAAVLGCDEERFDRLWLERGGSRTLDVYDLSAEVIDTVRHRLGPLAARVRSVQADLNFAELPAARYDVIWSSGCLHHVVNLEHLLAQVERALRQVPPRWRRYGVEEIVPPHPGGLSPFCAVRPDVILPLAEARFELVHQRFADPLFPLDIYVDLDTIARDEPALLERIEEAARDAERDPATPPSVVYAVFRERGSDGASVARGATSA